MNRGDPITTANVAEVQEIIRIADTLDAAVDAKQWETATSLFFEKVLVELPGAAPATVTGAELIGSWATNLGPAKTSLHLRTNHRVHLAGDTARLDSHGYAWNRLEGHGDPLWEVWGTYVHNFTRTGDSWKISGFAFTPTHERGNDKVKTTPG